MKRAAALAGLLGFVAATWAMFAATFAVLDATHGRDDGMIVVGSKSFSESYILAELFAQAIEARTGVPVERRLNLGSTQICQAALRSGAIDLYPEYTGTGLMAILQEPRDADGARVLDRVRSVFATRWGLTWLEPLGFSNTYVLAMRSEEAERRGVRTISDLRNHADLRWGVPPEFLHRDDGFAAMASAYGLQLDGPPRAIEAGLMYAAVAEGTLDVVSAYSTDARIDKFELALLEDDQRFFPPYEATPLVRAVTLARHPEVREALVALGGTLDAAAMRMRNGQVDIEGRDPADVARELLAALSEAR